MTPPPIGTGNAVFLDIDGTLIDIAPTPQEVMIPPTLHETLRRLQAKLGGALAVITGRPLADIDRLVGAGIACAAEHGGIVREADGTIREIAKRPARFEVWRDALQAYAAAHPGVIVEVKTFNLVAHYRQVPELKDQLGALVRDLVGDAQDAIVLPAHCAYELKPRIGNKGDALADFMAKPPFTGRVPLFAGDDVTDEPAIERADALGGTGLHVARDFGGRPQAVRAWLEAGLLS